MSTSYYKLAYPWVDATINPNELKLIANEGSECIIEVDRELITSLYKGFVEEDPVCITSWGGVNRGTVIEYLIRDLDPNTMVFSEYGAIHTLKHLLDKIHNQKP